MRRWILDVTKEVVMKRWILELCAYCDRPSSFHSRALHSIFFRWSRKVYYLEDKFELVKNKHFEILKLMEDTDGGVGHRETTQKSNYVIKVHSPKKSKTKGSSKR